MDGGRRRRRRSAAEVESNAKRAAWYAWWRSVRFAAHFGGWERFEPVRFVAGPISGRACPEDLPRPVTTLASPGTLRTGLCPAPEIRAEFSSGILKAPNPTLFARDLVPCE